MISTKIIDSNCMSIFKLMQPNKEAQKHKEYAVFACIWPLLALPPRHLWSARREVDFVDSKLPPPPEVTTEELREVEGKKLDYQTPVSFTGQLIIFVPPRLCFQLLSNKQQVARIRRMNDIIEAKTQETKWFPARKDTERVWIGKLRVFMQRIIASCLCVFVFGWQI